MQYLAAALAALAVSGYAAPHFPPKDGYGSPAAPAPGAGTGIGYPTASGVAFPVPTGFSSTSGLSAPVSRDDGDDDDEEEEEEEASDEDEDESSSDEEEEESSDDSEESSSTASSSSPSSTASSSNSTAATTSAASVSDSTAASGGSLPASSGSSALDAVQTIAAGESFDGGMVMFDRGTSCTGQSEGGDSDAVFELEDGASLSNVIIGPNQIEGVHCFGACTLTNVWWSAVCEDAFTIKEQDAGVTTNIVGGGAFGAEDKVLQHNGGGTMSVSGFTVEGFGKLYRSCGNCDSMYERHVIFSDITATDGKSLAGINSNYGDTATFTNIVASGVSDICVEYEGNDTGDEPEKISSGPSDYCIYSTSDVTTS